MTEAARQMSNADLPRDERHCAGETGEGEPCGVMAHMLRYDEDSDAWWCIRHSPDPGLQELVRAASQRGGVTSKLQRIKRASLDPGELGPLNSLADAKRWAAIIAEATATGRLGAAQANAALRAVGEVIKAHGAMEDASTLAAVVRLVEEKLGGAEGAEVLPALRRLVARGRRE